MTENSSSIKGVWAGIGKAAVVLTILWTGIQLYTRIVTTDITLETEGNCEPFYFPASYQQRVKEAGTLITSDEIKNVLPKDLKDSDSVARGIKGLVLDKLKRVDDAVVAFKDLRSVCMFTILNAGNKEAQDIKLELPRSGQYALEQLGQPNKEDKFDKVIQVGKLNPGGKAIITTWNSNFTVDVDSFEQSRFRVTHTNGVVPIQFLAKTQTYLGWIYESYPRQLFCFS